MPKEIISLGLVGAGSAAWQAVAVREALAVSDGNELTVALSFGVWLTLTAWGAWLSTRTHGEEHVEVGGWGLGAVMPLALVGARWWAGRLLPGTNASAWQVLVGAVVLLGPGCMLAGWLYGRLAAIAAQSMREQPRDGNVTGRAAALAYGIDSLGAGIAGLVLGWWLLDWLLPFQVVALAVVFVWGAMVLWRRGTVGVGRRLLVGGLLAGGLAATPLDVWTLSWALPGRQSVVQVRSSSRGLVVETVDHGQRQLLSHRMPLLVPSDARAGDQYGYVLPAIVGPREHVAWLGIPPGDTLSKLLGQGVLVVDVVAGEPVRMRWAKRMAPGGRSARVRWHGVDERGWLRSVARDSLDLVIIQAAAPTTMAGARLYSREVFALVRRALRPGGVLVVTLPGHGEYATQAQQRFHATVAATLRSVFSHVLPVPVDWTWYVASDGTLPQADDLARLAWARIRSDGGKPDLLDSSWLQDRLSHQRMHDAAAWARGPAEVSTDDVPVVQRVALDAWTASMDPSARHVILLLLSVLLVAGVVGTKPQHRPVRTAVLVTGFGSLTLQLVWMAALQTAIGALYRDVATLSGAFLLATFAGTQWAAGRRGVAGKRTLVALQVVQGLVAAGLAWAVAGVLDARPATARLVAVASSALVGFLAGAMVACASGLLGLYRKDVAGSLFSADLVGAAMASLLTYVWLVPSWGLTGTTWVVVGLSAVAAWLVGVGDVETSAQPEVSRWPLPAALLVGAVLALQAPEISEWAVQLTLTRQYAVVVWLVLVLALAVTLEPSRWHKWRVALERRWQAWIRRWGMAPWRLVSFLVLLPVAVLPIHKCYYRVPFVFCHVCPQPCVFGILRPYVVTTAVLSNLTGHVFCERFCPLGRAQVALASIRRRSPKRLRRFSRVLGTASLILFLYAYLQAGGWVPTWGESWADVLSSSHYARQTGTLIVAAGLLVASFWVRRPFCTFVCPIGMTARFFSWVLRRWAAADKPDWARYDSLPPEGKGGESEP